MLLKACINGARRPDAHPMLPLTPVTMAWAATAVVRAGAGAVHLHVRRADRSESLDGDDVARTLAVVRAAIPSTPVGMSTGAWILNNAAQRHAVVSKWSVLPDFVSVNFNEEGSPALAELLIGRGVGIEAGLFDASAAEQAVRSGIAGRCLRILLEPRGRDVADALKAVAGIESVLDKAAVKAPRLLHGSGATAWPLIDEAARRGYDTRAGLEDILELPDGRVAADNAAVVAEAARRIAAVAR